MESNTITVYGAHWCPDCRQSKLFLGEHLIPYRWVDIESDADAERLVIEKNQGKRIIPTIVFEDGSFLSEPSNAELAEKLGLKTKAARNYYDLIIIGGGPAGLTAAIYGAREALDTLVVERAALGGQAAATGQLDNMPGFPDGVEGIDFGRRLRQQAERFGVEILQAQEVAGIHVHDRYRCIRTAGGDEYSAQALLIATGSRYKRLGVPGESDYIGAGIHFCATCDGPFYKGKHVAVIGGGNSAAEESLLLTRFADRIDILVRKGQFSASPILAEKVLSHSKITVHWHTEVKAFSGKEGKLNRLQTINNQTAEENRLPVDGAFVFIGLAPNSAFLKDTGIYTNPWGFIVTGHQLLHLDQRPESFEDRDPLMMETSVPGIFAAGDVRDQSTKQAVSAAGEGSAALMSIRDYLKQ